MNKIQILVRWILNIILLIIVWKNNHWSVALSLTMTAGTFEAMTLTLNSIRNK